MDHVLDWRLTHRDEAEMNRLFLASKFARPCSRILFEDEGINLLANASNVGRCPSHQARAPRAAMTPVANAAWSK